MHTLNISEWSLHRANLLALNPKPSVTLNLVVQPSIGTQSLLEADLTSWVSWSPRLRLTRKAVYGMVFGVQKPCVVYSLECFRVSTSPFDF